MPTEDSIASTNYFDTPERAERLKLISHLLNNAEEVPYLRAPSGAGKTRAVAHLSDSLAESYQLVWVDTSVMRELSEAVCAELGLDVAEVDWPDGLLAQAGDQPVLVVVDDADALDLASIGDLFNLHERGVRLLFLGNGGLAQLKGDWDLQFVDFPPLTEAQSLAFIRSQAGGEGVSEAMAVGLHRAAEGLPGHLLNALTAIPAATPPVPASPSVSRKVWPLWIGGGLAAGLLGATLYFQDDINALFDAQDESSLPLVSQSVESSEPEPEPEPAALAADDSALAQVVPEPVDPPVPPQVQPDDAIVPDTELPAEAPPVAVPPAPESAEFDLAAPSPAEVPVAPDSEPELDTPDPLLDAVIEEAIAAAAQAPKSKPEPTEGQSAAEPQLSEPAMSDPAATALPQPEPSRPEEGLTPEPALDAVAAAPKPADAPPPAPPRTLIASESHDLVWLRSQAGTSYTLQLVGARDRAAIGKFIKRYQLKPPYAVYQRDLNGAPWYSLVQGVFANRDEAVAARSRMPGKLSQSGVWPRTFGSIQAQLP